jgi:hypothetical protein
LTLRAENGQELLEKAESTLIHLLEMGCIPFLTYSGSSYQKKEETQEESPPDESDPAWCPIHEVYMTRREKNGKVWYSHKVNGKWCNNGNGKKE